MNEVLSTFICFIVNFLGIKVEYGVLLPSSFDRKLTGTFGRTLTSIMTALG